MRARLFIITVVTMIMYGSMNLYRTNSKIDDFKFR